MKTTRTAAMVLGIAAILGLAFWIRRPAGPAAAAGRLDAAAIVAEKPGTGLGAQAATEAVTPEMIESLTTATAQIVRGDGSKEAIRSVDGEFDRVQVEPNEHLKIRLALRDFDSGRAVLVEADNGEKESIENQLNRRRRAAKIREDAQRKSKKMAKALREE